MRALTVRTVAFAAMATLSLSLASCATRALPARFPASAAASPAAAEAPPGVASVALTADPPLPGDPLGAWRGLDDDAGTLSEHAAPQETHHAR